MALTKLPGYTLDTTKNFTFANANVTGNINTGNANVTGNIITGNANLGNAATANFFVGNGSLLTGLPAGYTDSNVAAYLPTYTGNLTAGNTVITGNLTVSGTTITANVTSIIVKDPIIEQGGDPAGALSTNDGKDRGQILHYYTTAPVDAFMGWDNSNGEFAFASNATLSAEVATFNSFGNVRANFFIGNGSALTSIAGANVTGTVGLATFATTANAVAGANVSGAVGLATFATTANAVAGANVSGTVASATVAASANAVAGANVSGQVANALISGTVYTNAQPNITSVGTLSSVAITGNVTAGNANLGNLVTANFFSGNGSLLTGITVSAGSSIVSGNSNVNIPSANGNINFSAVGNANIVVITGTGANITGTANVTGNLTASNLTVTNKTNLGSNANITITGGTAGYALTTDGTGNLSWSASSGGAGGGLTYTAATTPPASGNVAGDQWFNTTANVLYEYINDGTSAYWVDVQTPTVSSATTTTYVNRSYTGDGSTATYTVTSGCDVNNILVFINGVCQMPTVDYTVSGSVLTLIPAAAAAAVIQVRELPR